MNSTDLTVLEKKIEEKIYIVRGRKVMLDRDLAELYEVKTHVLNQAVKRNVDRFPIDFAFQLERNEFKNLTSQIVISSWGGTRTAPWAFTEHGILMLSSVLRSMRAVQVNIQIMRIFTKIKEYFNQHKELKVKIAEIEKKVGTHDLQIKTIFEAIKQLINPPLPPKKQIGFRMDD